MDHSTATPSFQFTNEDIDKFEQQRKALLQSIHNADKCLSLANWKEHSLCAVSAIDTRAVYDHYIEAATHLRTSIPPFSDELMAYQRAKKTVMETRAKTLAYIDQLDHIIIQAKYLMCSKTDTGSLLQCKKDTELKLYTLQRKRDELIAEDPPFAQIYSSKIAKETLNIVDGILKTRCKKEKL